MICGVDHFLEAIINISRRLKRDASDPITVKARVASDVPATLCRVGTFFSLVYVTRDDHQSEVLEGKSLCTNSIFSRVNISLIFCKIGA